MEMEMKKLATVLAAAALGIAGCGGGGDGAEGVPATATSRQVPFDRAFIDAMVPHHRAAISMAREAKEAGLAQPELVAIADDIVATQQAEIDQMLDWRAQWFGSRERGLQATALEVLGLTAAEAGMEHGGTDLASVDNVDQAFAGMLIGHHVGAIRMATLADEKAGHEEVRKLAGDIVAAQQREIDIMEAYLGGAHG
jgi:uncharacterized protein (DUF305 family)